MKKVNSLFWGVVVLLGWAGLLVNFRKRKGSMFSFGGFGLKLGVCGAIDMPEFSLKALELGEGSGSLLVVDSCFLVNLE